MTDQSRPHQTGGVNAPARDCVKRIDPEAEYYFDEGCHIIEMSNSAQDPELSIARARVEPGQTTRWHSLAATSERYVILSGTGLVEVGEQAPAGVGPGDTVIIPPGAPQRIANTGNEDLVFLALCTPRFRVEAYRDLEE